MSTATDHAGERVDEAVVVSAARRLAEAAATRRPCAPIRDLIGPDDIATAYRVQEHFNAARTGVVGRKIGATSKAVQDQLGVDQPDFGVLFADMDYRDGAEIPMGRLLQPRAEAEVAFVLARDLADGELDVEQCRAAVDYAVAALEIVDSRITDWDISFADTVADNASAGVYVLGEHRRALREFEPVDVTMTMRIDGEPVSTGTGADCLGDPLNALSWLARRAREFGDPLRAGQVILSGALGPMRPLHPGATVTATVSGLGSVTASFGADREAGR
ncbi:2-keto-4-pentenoate hydratase [Nocardia spumae]|uniref:2-keto-4-pentenoate hydratase n=1 Tax=Nocardia spumae TaxID=2887190 RepID=UPI001D14D7D8|nr:fumarylacetoacetate hydrolase family protein [Nocardia spumae]